MFRQLGFKNISLEFAQYPLYTTRHKYSIVLLFETIKSQLLQENLITETEFIVLLKNIKKLAEDDDVIMIGSRNTQIVSQNM